jgi:[1-hydroxy-2-(trimethylamino)ethyl]phosphonate dioxygenase
MPADFIVEIAQAFADRGGDSYGEHVSQLDHALQCAWLAQEDGAGDHLIAAALLHDYGHLFEGRGDAAERDGRDARHELHGARALRRWFGPEVVGPIALHVLAKRYLCAAEPGYAEALSPASVLSLKLQGGAFTPAQCRRFERSRFSADAIRVRRWDDTGKVVGHVVPRLEQYWPILRRIADSRGTRQQPTSPFNC